MRAAVFTMDASVDMATGRASLGQTFLAVLVSAVTVAILLLALGAAHLELLFRGYARREARTALRLKVADALRGQRMDTALREVATELRGVREALARRAGEPPHV